MEPETGIAERFGQERREFKPAEAGSKHKNSRFHASRCKVY
jgi:hypothetical protein